MKNALKQEFCRVFRDRLLLLLLAASLAVGFWYGTRPIMPGMRRTWQVDDPRMELCTEADFEKAVEDWFASNYRIETVKRLMRLEDSTAETLAELYAESVPYAYYRILLYIGSLLPVMLLLSIFQLSTGRETGTLRSCAGFGGSLRRVVLARLLVYYLLSFAVLLPILLVQTALYAPGIGARFGGGYVLRCTLQRLLLDLSVLSLYAWLSFALRRKRLRIFLLILLAVVFWCLNVLAGFLPMIMLFIPFPPFLHGLRALYGPEAGPVWVILSMAVSLAWVYLMTLAGLRAAEKDRRAE